MAGRSTRGGEAGVVFEAVPLVIIASSIAGQRGRGRLPRAGVMGPSSFLVWGTASGDFRNDTEGDLDERSSVLVCK